MKDYQQIPLPLSYRKAYDRDDFLIAPCNLDAVRWLDAYPNWPHPIVLLLGDQGCGKTHLASVYTQNIIQAKDLTFDMVANLPQTFALEDIDEENIDEVNLFYLYNEALQKQKNILMTARTMPNWKLPDLRTRMNTIPVIKIGQPDDSVIMSLILKEFDNRGLEIESEVIDYLLKHIERSFSFIQEFIQETALLSLTFRHKITIPLVKEALNNLKERKLRGDI